jgi:predicted SpoU family rRNA methylase
MRAATGEAEELIFPSKHDRKFKSEGSQIVKDWGANFSFFFNQLQTAIFTMVTKM